MKPTPILVQRKETDIEGKVVFDNIPIGKYILQFDGHTFMKPFTKEIEVDVNDGNLEKEIKVQVIDEAYVILCPQKTESTDKHGNVVEREIRNYHACLYPSEAESDFHSMPIEMSKKDDQYMAVVEPGKYWVYIDFGSGGQRRE